MEEVLEARRCPHCRALAAHHARWCSLCFASLDEDTAPGDTVPEETAVEDSAPEDTNPEDIEPPVEAEPDATHPVDPPEAMLALLAVEAGSPLGSLGPLSAPLSSPGVRLGVMLGGLVLCTGVFLGLMWLLGHIV